MPEMEDVRVLRALVGVHPRATEPAALLLCFSPVGVADFAATQASRGEADDHSAGWNVASGHAGLLNGYGTK